MKKRNYKVYINSIQLYIRFYIICKTYIQRQHTYIKYIFVYSFGHLLNEGSRLQLSHFLITSNVLIFFLPPNLKQGFLIPSFCPLLILSLNFDMFLSPKCINFIFRNQAVNWAAQSEEGWHSFWWNLTETFKKETLEEITGQVAEMLKICLNL